MKKKDILFVCYGLGIGGIEKCLVNLLNVLPEERYSVEILLMNPEYELKPQIKRAVTYLDTFQYAMNIEDTLGQISLCQGFVQRLTLLWAYVCFRVRIKFGRPAWRGFKPIAKRYDIAVAYSQNGYVPYYVIDKVKAQKKVLWYHNGAYERTGKEREKDRAYYAQFDQIVAVSADCKKVLRDVFGFAEDQLLVLRNICDVEGVLKGSLQYDPIGFGKAFFHIVTVGRMTGEKGADLALEACKILCDEGRKICWHWIGEGNRTMAIREKVAEMKLGDNFILEGSQGNPYPFVRCADVYVQPSYYEAYSTTVTEAKILKRPIVATDVGGMRDQLTHGRNGLIVPIDAGKIADAVRTLMDNDNMRDGFISELEQETFCSETAIEEYMRTVFS